MKGIQKTGREKHVPFLYFLIGNLVLFDWRIIRCHYYKGELLNPYPDDDTAKKQRLGWDKERSEYYLGEKATPC